MWAFGLAVGDLQAEQDEAAEDESGHGAAHEAVVGPPVLHAADEAAQDGDRYRQHVVDDLVPAESEAR